MRIKLWLAAPLAAWFVWLPTGAQIRFAPDRIDIAVDHKPFTTLHFGLDANKPYLAPLRSASGTIVTRQYPMENVDGESRDHPHHRGLWFSYDDVNGVKFWENDPASKNPHIGRIVARSAEWQDGGDSGALVTLFDWNDPEGRPLLTERRVTTFHSDPALRIVDFDITLTARREVTFGDTKEGAFGIRLADSLTEKRGGVILNAEGLQGMKNVWGQRSDWMDYSGSIGGEALGVAIFDHPSNPRRAPAWHARDYGLFALNPFGRRAFDPGAEESRWRLAEGQALRFRWRVVIHPGDARSAHIADLYANYSRAAPPVQPPGPNSKRSAPVRTNAASPALHQ